MVYEMLRRSKEADIVIWDSHNYPSLPLLDHSFYFAESVRAVIECKSNWNNENFLDVLDKCAAVDDIVPAKEPSLADQVTSLQDQVDAIQHGFDYAGALLVKPQIGTAAMFLSGGQSMTPEKLLELVESGRNIDREWPHVLLFLDTGLLVVKEQSGEDGTGRLDFFQYGDDALLAFSIALLRLIDDRVVHSEARFFMERYAFQILDFTPTRSHQFPLRRPPVGRRIFAEELAEPNAP